VLNGALLLTSALQLAIRPAFCSPTTSVLQVA
jgi:hypothetical protein